MTTEQTAQQLELAAQILRTGHPWEYRVKKVDGEEWHDGKISDVSYYAHYSKIRPVLATPPDNRPLHNPDNLTAEAVGVGYRLTLGKEEWSPNQEFWYRAAQKWERSSHFHQSETFRLPLSVPWPEPEKPDPYAELKAAHAAGKGIQGLIGGHWINSPHPTWKYPVDTYRVKPDEPVVCAVVKPEPAFQLPPAPPGMRWHREDGWEEGDLPQGYRPCVVDEREAISGYMESMPDRNSGLGWVSATYHSSGLDFYSFHHRTTRPLTFTHAGKTWTWHRPGDPMPCDGDRDVCCLVTNGSRRETNPAKGRYMAWSVTDEKIHFWGVIIGWRYAEPQTKTVPLSPEDVPSGSVFRGAGEAKDPDDKGWCLITSCSRTGIRYWRQSDSDPAELPWKTLHESGAQINRSIPLTGKWNPDAWEPCSKPIPA